MVACLPSLLRPLPLQVHPGEVTMFPTVQKSFKVGDLVTLVGSTKKCRVMDTYEQDKRRFYNVATVIPGNPLLVAPELWVVGGDDLDGPLIKWGRLETQWWTPLFDDLIEDTLYYKARDTPFVRGNVVAVYARGTQPEIARVVSSGVDRGGQAFFKVITLIFCLFSCSYTFFFIRVAGGGRSSSRFSAPTTPSGSSRATRPIWSRGPISAGRSMGSSGPGSPSTPRAPPGSRSLPRSRSRSPSSCPPPS